MHALVTFLILNAVKDALFYHIIHADFRHVIIHFFVSLVLDFLAGLFLFRYRKPYLFIGAYLIQLLYLGGNLTYVLYYDDFIHLQYYYSLFLETMELLQNFSMPENPVLWVFLIDAPFAVVIVLVYPHVHASVAKIQGYLTTTFGNLLKNMYAVAAVCFLLLFLGILNTWNIYNTGDQVSVIHRQGLLARNVVDLLRMLEGEHEVEELSYGHKISVQERTAERNNIVMIQVESLDARIVNAKYRGKYIAPYLHFLSKNSVYYPYCLSYRKAGGTSDCEIAVLNSMEPLNDFPTMKLKNYTYPNSLVKLLPKGAYQAIAFHGYFASFYNRKRAYRQMGFNDFYSAEKMSLIQEGFGVPDKEVFDYVLKKYNLRHSLSCIM